MAAINPGMKSPEPPRRHGGDGQQKIHLMRTGAVPVSGAGSEENGAIHVVAGGKKIGSVEIIVFHNVLGDVCRSHREGQTGEDFLQEIFELIPATAALRK